MQICWAFIFTKIVRQNTMHTVHNVPYYTAYGSIGNKYIHYNSCTFGAKIWQDLQSTSKTSTKLTVSIFQLFLQVVDYNYNI